MDILTIDFETYFNRSKNPEDYYSLDNMTTEAYVRDAKFDPLGASIRGLIDNTGDYLPATWYTPFELHHIFSQIDWSNTAVLCHHAQFDGLILAHHFGVRPAFWFDTLSMARLVLGNHLSKSLGSLAAHFGLGAKNVPYDLFEGRHWDQITTDVQGLVADGCCHDAELTWELFGKLAASVPQEEFQLIDSTIRMFTEPCLVGNIPRLGAIWQEETQAKAALLAELQVGDGDLRKDQIFAELLRNEGVEVGDPVEDPEGPGLKPGKNGPIFAFAKTDDFIRDLQDDEDPRIAMLADARIAEKSNITTTRAERLGWMATRGPLCVYLNYCGAHTTRWSGGDKLNWQNRKRGGKLEKAIEAPAGHAIVVRDASQIECRLLNFVAGQADVIERFRNKEDPYIAIASKAYGFAVTKANEKERGTGKQLELSCGYGCGARTIQVTAKKGTYGPPVYIDLETAETWKNLYRETHQAIASPNGGYWAQGNEVLKLLNAGQEFQWGPLHIKAKRIYLPNGAPLIYETLHWHEGPKGDYWRIATRRGFAKLYGAKLVENVIQALARLCTAQAWLRCRAAGIRIVSMEHDKLLACVPANDAPAADAFMRAEMMRAPDWLPGIPLNSDGYVSDTFAKPEK